MQVVKYKSFPDTLSDRLAGLRKGVLTPIATRDIGGARTVLKGAKLVDPANHIESQRDLSFQNGKIIEVAEHIETDKDDIVYNLNDLQVWPGIVDMHIHLGDLFEVSTDPIVCAAKDGVTVGLSPGAGNTFMAPALLGAEVDRGLPLNVGVFLGAMNVCGTLLDDDELVSLFMGTLDVDTALTKMSRNLVTCLTAPLIVGLKDHMGHWISSDEHLDRIFEITSRAGLVFMSHTQDPLHAERVVRLSKGRPVHLGHVNAAGCGTHGDPLDSMQRVRELLKQPHVSGEMVTSMLRPGGGNREGLRMPREVQKLACSMLEEGLIDILISDGQGDATMKGFGDSRDNVPCILELAQMGVLSLSQAVALMTINPLRLIGHLTRQPWWYNELGHLGPGARANITVVDPQTRRAVYTFVNGTLTAFEGRLIRRAYGCGGWVCKFGFLDRIGVGDLAIFSA